MRPARSLAGSIYEMTICSSCVGEDPDYVREFMANVPRDLMRWEAGYFMGPDGFVQGREFVHKDPDLSGQLEVDKHWYRFMMFGRLGYDLTLTREFFEQRLKHHFRRRTRNCSTTPGKHLPKTIPQVNRFLFRSTIPCFHRRDVSHAEVS